MSVPGNHVARVDGCSSQGTLFVHFLCVLRISSKVPHFQHRGQQRRVCACVCVVQAKVALWNHSLHGGDVRKRGAKACALPLLSWLELMIQESSQNKTSALICLVFFLAGSGFHGAVHTVLQHRRCEHHISLGCRPEVLHTNHGSRRISIIASMYCHGHRCLQMALPLTCSDPFVALLCRDCSFRRYETSLFNSVIPNSVLPCVFSVYHLGENECQTWCFTPMQNHICSPLHGGGEV